MSNSSSKEETGLHPPKTLIKERDERTNTGNQPSVHFLLLDDLETKTPERISPGLLVLLLPIDFTRVRSAFVRYLVEHSGLW